MTIPTCEQEAQKPPQATNPCQRADMHLHTIYSDGIYSPEALIDKCAALGIFTIALTDHDHIGGIQKAQEYGTTVGVEVISGVELSVSMEGKDIHILGYFFDPTNKQLQEVLSFFREQRFKRAERMVHKLNALHIPITMDAVLHHAREGAVGRPHIAHAMVTEGYVTSYHEAFARYLGTDCPAYETKYRLSPQEALKIIAQAGGLSFLAHPGKYATNGNIDKLIKLGLDGIEVIHPAHNESQVSFYRSLTEQYFLLESGGSDYHGVAPYEEKILGSYTIPESTVLHLKQRLFEKSS